MLFVYNSYIFSYEYNWILPEMSLYSNNAVFYGYSFAIEDFYHIFDWTAFDGAPRARFLSNFFLIINSKLRFLLFDYFPFIHTFSLTWIITLFNPIILFYILKKNNFSFYASIFTSLLFIYSIAYLGSLNLYFHPAKPLAITFFLLSILLNYHLKYSLVNLLENKFFYLLLLLYFFGFFLDESCFFMPLLSIVILRNILFKNISSLVIFSIPAFLFFIIILFVIPQLTNNFLNLEFNLFKWAVSSNDNLVISFSFFKNFFSNLYYLFFNNVFYLNSYKVYEINFSYLVITLSVILLSLNSIKNNKLFYFENLLFFIFFIFFQTILLTRHNQVLFDNFYYGGPAAIFLLLFFIPSIIDTNVIQFFKFEVTIKVFLCVYLLFISFNNYEKVSNAWRGNSGESNFLYFDDYFEYWALRKEPLLINYFKDNHPNIRLRYYLKELYLSSIKPKVLLTKPYSPVKE